MRSSLFAPLLAVAACALPQVTPSCSTSTTEVIVPSSTATFHSTYVTTVYATTPRDLGTFTDITSISSTRIIQTLTSTTTVCAGNDTVTTNPTTTVYTSSGSSPSTTSLAAPAGLSGYKKRVLGLEPRQDAACTVTSTFTTTYGQTYTYIKVTGVTSTYTDYTAFTQATVTSTTSRGTAYTVATEVATAFAQCGSTVNATSPTTTATVTQDRRCMPSALVSAAGGNNGSPDFGLQYIGTITGATFNTDTTDGSACCQLCVEAGTCAASAWDIRTGSCKLEFTAAWDTGAISCGNQDIIAYYDAGPNSPMAPGSGLFIADMCHTVSYFNAKPDDGS